VGRRSSPEADSFEAIVGGRKRILVIEDEVLLSMDMEASLVEAGYEVVGPVGMIASAKKLIADEGCDVALVDANLGGNPVDDLAKLLTNRNIPFAFVTGYGRNALPREFRQALMLSKPYSTVELLAVVQILLGRPMEPGGGASAVDTPRSGSGDA
jgi:DNA-binding response OmpR family regulator